MAMAILQSLECLDILVKIFFHLHPLDVVTSGLTCKLWHRASSDPSLWRHLCLQKWPSLSHPSAKPSLSLLRSFHGFFAQRESKKVDDPEEAGRWLFCPEDITIVIDVSLSDRSVFSTAIAGSSVVKERLRFKLPRHNLLGSTQSSSSSPTDLCDGKTSPSSASAFGYGDGDPNSLSSKHTTSSSASSSDLGDGNGDLQKARPFHDLHVQLSVIRHSDGLSACLVNGFPAPSSSASSSSSAKPMQKSPSSSHSSSRYGLKCVLLLIDGHAFLNFYW